jgi:hypothetical protein
MFSVCKLTKNIAGINYKHANLKEGLTGVYTGEVNRVQVAFIAYPERYWGGSFNPTCS